MSEVSNELMMVMRQARKQYEDYPSDYSAAALAEILIKCLDEMIENGEK